MNLVKYLNYAGSTSIILESHIPGRWRRHRIWTTLSWSRIMPTYVRSVRVCQVYPCQTGK